MTKPNFDLQKVLRTYHRQLGEASRLSRKQVNERSAQQDSATISQERMKRLLTDRIAQEIINQILAGAERNETSEAIMSQLSKEYGKPLHVGTDGQNLAFKFLRNGEEAKNLSPAENAELNKKFIDITKAIVYTNLV